jgi:hypothetical protein
MSAENTVDDSGDADDDFYPVQRVKFLKGAEPARFFIHRIRDPEVAFEVDRALPDEFILETPKLSSIRDHVVVLYRFASPVARQHRVRAGYSSCWYGWSPSQVMM